MLIEDLFKEDLTGVRQTKNGNYEAYVSDCGSFVSLGTYLTENTAREEVRTFKRNRLKSILLLYGKDISRCKKWNKYIVCEDGDIFTLKGTKMIPSIDHCGYLHGSINGKTISYHRIIAECFCYNDDPLHKTDVNHIDGNKVNNHYTNLEWVSRSENVKHAYENGLEKKYFGDEWREMHYKNKGGYK